MSHEACVALSVFSCAPPATCHVQTQLQADLRGARAENETLGEENRELRERLEVLEYLVATAGENGGVGEPQVPVAFVAGGWLRPWGPR